MNRETELMLETQFSDVRSWVRETFKKTLDRRELEEPNLREDILTIASQAYHTNFPAESDYYPDGLGLSRLKKYNGDHVEFIQTFVNELRQAQDLCGYIQQHLTEANFLGQRAA